MTLFVHFPHGLHLHFYRRYVYIQRRIRIGKDGLESLVITGKWRKKEQEENSEFDT